MKKRLRAKMRQQRSRLSAEAIARKSQLILENLITSKILERGSRIGVYCATMQEAQTSALIQYLFSQNKQVFAPKVEGDTLAFYHIQSIAELAPGFNNILEPTQMSESEQFNLDLIIVPCVAVDLNGNRLGRGAGFYDRFLAVHPVTYKICLALEEQIVKHIPTQAHDMPMDLVVTDDRVILTPKNKLAKLINGTDVAHLMLQQTRYIIKKNNIVLALAIVLVGQHKPSQLYVQRKIAACALIGIKTVLFELEQKTTREELFALINKLNQDTAITGILVQLPLPTDLQNITQSLLDNVVSNKDVDGLGSHQQQLLAAGVEELVCCTPKGIMHLLESLKIPLKNKVICLVGHGALVNKPLEKMLQNRGITPLICTKATDDLKAITIGADIIISATGVPKLLSRDHVKPGSIVIDAGISEINGTTCGDCDTASMLDKVRYISPVPGGIGPITIAALTSNLIKAWQLQNPRKNLSRKINSVAILTSRESWFVPHAAKICKQLNSHYKTELYFDAGAVPIDTDIIFILSYFDQLSKEFIAQHGLCLIVHESKLPHTRGWAPMFWQLLSNKKSIDVSLIMATEDKTSGDVLLTEKIQFSGLELYDELRTKQASATATLCSKFLRQFSPHTHFKTTKQIGAASLYRRRTPNDSEININKSLKSQFNQLRIASNNEFPAFFYYRNKKFIIKIFDDDPGTITQE